MYRREWRFKKAIANVVKMALLGMVWGCFILFLLLYAEEVRDTLFVTGFLAGVLIGTIGVIVIALVYSEKKK